MEEQEEELDVEVEELYKAAVISTAPYISTHIFLLYFLL